MRRKVRHHSSNSVDDWGHQSCLMENANLVMFSPKVRSSWFIVTQGLKIIQHFIKRGDNVFGGLYGTFKRLVRIYAELRINVRIGRKEFWVWALDGKLPEIGNSLRLYVEPLVPSFCPTIVMHLNLLLFRTRLTNLSELHHLCFEPLPDSILNINPVSHFILSVLF